MNTSSLELAVIRRMLRDPEVVPVQQAFDPLALVVTERNLSEVGFLTSFSQTSAAKVFSNNASLRWGNVVGRLDSKVDVDFVVYVDDGYVTGVEGCTFGGEAWPSDVGEFKLTDLFIGSFDSNQ